MIVNVYPPTPVQPINTKERLTHGEFNTAQYSYIYIYTTCAIATCKTNFRVCRLQESSCQWTASSCVSTTPHTHQVKRRELRWLIQWIWNMLNWRTLSHCANVKSQNINTQSCLRENMCAYANACGTLRPQSRTAFATSKADTFLYMTRYIYIYTYH